MTVSIFGNPTCPDCRLLQATLMANPGKLDFQGNDIRQLPALKEFLRIRDTAPEMAKAREKGFIGIPCIVDENGVPTLDWKSFVASRGLIVVETAPDAPAEGASCSLKDRNC